MGARGNIRKGFAAVPDYPMIRESGVGNDLDIPLGHVTAGTIVARSFLIAKRKRDSTTLFRMAGETFTSKKRGRVRTRGLNVRIVTANAAEPACTVSITLAKCHREIVLEQITLQGIFATWWNHQNSQRSI